MAVRSSTTCGYDSHAISVDVRYWTIVYDQLAMLSEPESVRARELIIDQHAFASGTELSGPCRLWLIVGYFHPGSVKKSSVCVRWSIWLNAPTRAARLDPFLGAEQPRCANPLHHLRAPFSIYRTVTDLLP